MSADSELPERAPITIEFMLVCYFSAEPAQYFEDMRWNSIAGNETREFLLREGLVDENYKATERGEAWVKYICATPLPEQCWRLPERGTP